ncbi:MAG: ATP-binding protein [Eubacterium sp.]
MNSNGFHGNEKVLNQLGNLMDSGRFPHAIVIEGEQGLGKKRLARLVAAALVCRLENKPCMNCSQCRKAFEKIHPDIFEYAAQGGARSFHVDTVRQVINDAYMQPNEADYKIYILANADLMNESAQNAILKILEEPPSYAVFILTVQSKSSLLDTIISRCVVVSLSGVECSQGARYITDCMEGVDFQTAENALKICNGNIGKAMESLQDSKTNEFVELCNNLCTALADGNEYSMLISCSALQKDRQSVVFVCDFLKNIFRDALVYNESGEAISGQYDCVKALRTKLTKQKLIKLINVCDEVKALAEMNVNNSLLITKICYSLREAVGR